ncbi:MAG TPA: transposase [Opitutaceae bacterium]|nr:transposase [Opitutaceae bacterium]
MNVFFVTLCTHQRKPILARADVHALWDESICRADSWLVSRYLIMPDHIHLFCFPNPKSSSVGVSLIQWIKFLKTTVSNRWPRLHEQPIWQKDFWDTEVRSEHRYHVQWMYVSYNPVRKGLVDDPADWPFQGGEKLERTGQVPVEGPAPSGLD